MKKITFTLLPLFFAAMAFSQDLSQNLLLRYPFDGNANDMSGQGQNGTPFNMAYGPDRYGNPNSAAYFNGINSYVNFPNVVALKPNLPVSFSFLINYISESYNQQVVFNTSFEENRSTGVWFNSSLSNNGHAVNFGDGSYSYSPYTRSTFLCTKIIEFNSWHLVTVVVNAENDMKIYIDCGEALGTYTGFGQGLVYSDTPGCIGRHDRSLDTPPDYFKGYIDDFRYWNRALTPADVAALCALLLVDGQQATVADTLAVYPNPAHDKLNILTDLENIQSVKLYNSFGQAVYSGVFKNEIDVSGFTPGIYFIKVENASKTQTKKIVIQ